MKCFALLWTVGFLLAIYPVMKLDHRREVKKRWEEFSKLFLGLVDAQRNLNFAINSATKSIVLYKVEMEKK